MLSSILLDVTLPNKPVFFCEGSRIPSSEHKLDGLVKEFGLRVDQLFPFGTLENGRLVGADQLEGGLHQVAGGETMGQHQVVDRVVQPERAHQTSFAGRTQPLHLVLGGQNEKRLEARLPIGQNFAISWRDPRNNIFWVTQGSIESWLTLPNLSLPNLHIFKCVTKYFDNLT